MARKTFHPYELYEASVIDPKNDLRTLERFYGGVFRKKPHFYREDFCGTFIHSVEWVKKSPRHRAWALDIDPKPLHYGLKTHLPKLNPEQRRRLKVLKRDVLKGIDTKVDLVSAVNFSYWCFKKRSLMKRYFESVYRNLKRKGMLVMDMMGGITLQDSSMDRHKIDWGKGMPTLLYFWEQKHFDPLTQEAKFAIHYQVGKSKRKMKNVFRYDWRIWTPIELQEILEEVGFSDSQIYWEGSTRSGEGSGTYTRKEHAPTEDVWIAYLLAIKR